MDNNRAALAVATAGLVVGVYGASLPRLSDTRAQHDDAGHLERSQQYAASVSVAVVLGVAAVARSAEVALIGTGAVLALAVAYRAAVAYTPAP